jgi:hypothetical protein
MTGPDSPWFPIPDQSTLDQVWVCPEEDCDYREYGFVDHPLAEGVCPRKTHRRQELIRESPRGRRR